MPKLLPIPVSEGRKDRIHRRLLYLQQKDVIRDWYCSGGTGLRWVVEKGSGGDRVYTTREVEIFIDGAMEALASLQARKGTH